MGLEFLSRVRKTSVLSAVVVFVAVSAYVDLKTGSAFVIGCAWTLVNLWLISLLVRELVDSEDNGKTRLIIIGAIKIPALYLIGALILRTGLPVIALLAGFMWPLSMIVLKAVGRITMKMDKDAPLAQAQRKSR